MIGNQSHIAQGKVLAETFVVSKKKQFAFLNRTTKFPSKDIALKLRNRSLIKVVPGIQSAVAQEFVGGAVHLVASRRGHDADLSAGPFPILSPVRIRHDVKFMNRVHPE